MKAFSVFMLCCLALVACGADDNNDKEQPTGIDPELQSSIDYYFSIAPDRGDWDRVTFLGFEGSVQHDRGGECDASQSAIRISINERWQQFPGEARDALVARLLANCVHGKPFVHSGSRLMRDVFTGDSGFWHDHLGDEIRTLFE